MLPVPFTPQCYPEYLALESLRIINRDVKLDTSLICGPFVAHGFSHPLEMPVSTDKVIKDSTAQSCLCDDLVVVLSVP